MSSMTSEVLSAKSVYELTLKTLLLAAKPAKFGFELILPMNLP